MPEAIRVVVCDDHRLLTAGLSMLIDREPDLELVVPPLETGEHAIAACAEHWPDVVLMDIRLKGGIDGIEAARQIKELCPRTQVVIMSGSQPEDGVLVQLAEAGASGFVDKTEAVEHFLEVVRSASRGEMLIDSALLGRLLERAARDRNARRGEEQVLARLTPRERETLDLVVLGLGSEEIARRLGVSPGTVRTHIQNLLSKLGLHSKLEAVTFAIRAGIVPAPR